MTLARSLSHSPSGGLSGGLSGSSPEKSPLRSFGRIIIYDTADEAAAAIARFSAASADAQNLKANRMVSPQLRCCKCGTKFRAGKGALEADDELAGLLRRLSLERAPEQAARARGRRGAGESEA